MNRRDSYIKDYPPNHYRNGDYKNRWYNDRYNKPHWDKDQGSSHPLRNNFSYGSAWNRSYDRKLSPLNTNRVELPTKKACDSSSDVSEKFRDNHIQPPSHKKVENKLKTSDVRHVINNRRSSNTESERSTKKTYKDSNNLSQPTKSLAPKEKSNERCEATRNSFNLSVKPDAIESNAFLKAGYPNPIIKPNPVSSIKKYSLKRTKEPPYNKTNNSERMKNENNNNLHIQCFPKTLNSSVSGPCSSTPRAPNVINLIKQDEDVMVIEVDTENTTISGTKINEKNYAIQESLNTLSSNPCTSTRTSLNRGNSIKQEINEDIEPKEMPKEKTVNSAPILSQKNMNIPKSACESSNVSSTPKTSRSSADANNYLNLSSKIAVKSVENLNRMVESPSLPAVDNDSTLSLVESTQPDDTLLQTEADLSFSPEEPTSNTQVRDRSAPVLIEALTCSQCKAWAHSSKVFWCECRVICKSCKKKILNTTCNLCETTFAADARLVNFHMRVASTVHHPCRHQGCSHIVKPGVEHEDTCQYIPTKCFKCKKSVPTARLRQHFDSEHDKQVLTDKNFDVKYSYFTQVSQEGDIREIYCFAQGLLIPITLNKVDDKRDFIVSVPFINEAPSNITVTFEFKFKSYEFKRKVKARNDLEDGLKIVDLPSDIFNDWNDGKCKLNISILVKRRRIAENKPAKKKRKITTEGGD